MKTMEIRAFPADAVVLATGGNGIVFGRSTQQRHLHRHGGLAVYQQGACYANGEFIQVHPTAIPGADKLRLISESARGEGGRVWVPKDPRDRAPAARSPRKSATTSSSGNTPATATSCRATSRRARSSRRASTRSVGSITRRPGQNELEVYLDLTHKDESFLRHKLAGILEIYEKFAGSTPTATP
jgi:succinate dehydrogenase / fumarate reductase flavoprotein subunit